MSSKKEKFHSNESIRQELLDLAKKKVGLHICHINAQSLRDKMEELKLLFENSLIDVICVSETWLKEKDKDKDFRLNGYELYRGDRITKRRGGGVAIYIKNTIRSDFKCRWDDKDMVEYIFVEIKSSEEKLLIGCVYKPNRHTDTKSFLATLGKITAHYSDLVIAGDFNSDFLRDTDLRHDMERIHLQCVNLEHPTHVVKNAKNLLDIFFVKNSTKVLFYGQMPVRSFSRHFLIYTTYDYAVADLGHPNVTEEESNTTADECTNRTNRSTILGMTLKQLKKKARELGLPLNESKRDMQKRLIEYTSLDTSATTFEHGVNMWRISEMTVSDLKNSLKAHNLNLTGKKEDMQIRLLKYYNVDENVIHILVMVVKDLEKKLKDVGLDSKDRKKYLQQNILEYYNKADD